VKERIANILLVVVVTLLIWLYLEAESLTAAQQEVRISFVAGESNMIVTPVGEEWRGVATVRIEGSQAALSRTPRSYEIPIGSLGVPAEDGEHVIDLKAPLRASRQLQRAGVNLVDVLPQTMRLRVESVATLNDVEIRADLGAIEPSAPPTVVPARASVSGPRSTIDRLAAIVGGPHVVARVRPGAATNIPDGRPAAVRTPLELPGSVSPDNVQITPREAEVGFTVRSRSATAVVPAAPVQLITPPAESGRFRVEINADDEFVQGVTVIGASDLVEQVRSGQVRVVALLWLSSDELERRVDSKGVTFAVVRDGQVAPPPAGLTIRADDAVVRFQITPAQRTDGADAMPRP
jgi:hypothetical protein